MDRRPGFLTVLRTGQLPKHTHRPQNSPLVRRHLSGQRSSLTPEPISYRDPPGQWTQAAPVVRSQGARKCSVTLNQAPLFPVLAAERRMEGGNCIGKEQKGLSLTVQGPENSKDLQLETAGEE